MKYAIKYFLVNIAGRKGYVSVVEYPKKKFIVRFINDKFSDFINSFKTKGFGVDAIINSDEMFHVFENLDENEARKIWSQIRERLETSDHIVSIDGFDNG